MEYDTPTDPVVRKSIKDAVIEISNAKTIIDAQMQHIKDIKDNMKEKVPPATLGKLATDFHKQQFNKRVKESEEYQELYEIIMV